jgi:hypothetical protein
LTDDISISAVEDIFSSILILVGAQTKLTNLVQDILEPRFISSVAEQKER